MNEENIKGETMQALQKELTQEEKKATAIGYLANLLTNWSVPLGLPTPRNELLENEISAVRNFALSRLKEYV